MPNERPDAAILKAEEFSLARLTEIQEILTLAPAGKRLLDQGVAVAVSGSLGRLESLAASDIDLITLCPDGSEMTEVSQLDQEVRRLLRERLGVEVSQGQNFTGPTLLCEICEPSRIGGAGDNVNVLTKRICLLTEARAILNSQRVEEFRRAVMMAFLAAPEVKRHYLIPVIDEIVRYYRTLCIDYKSRVEYEGKPWAIRYLKLRCSRKYWFFSLMLGISSLLVQSEPDDDAAEDGLAELLPTPPSERIRRALDLAGLPKHQSLFTFYGRFLDNMSKPSVRSALHAVRYDSRRQSAIYTEMKRDADRLHRSMLEIIESLPAAWRRHVFSRFLLHS